MATHSTAPAVRSAIVSGLQTNLAGQQVLGKKVQVTYSNPGADELQNVACFLGDTKWVHIEPPVMRNGRRVVREENYEVTVHFLACVTGTDSSASEQAAMQMYSVGLEDLLANTPQLGVDGVVWALPDAGEMRSGWDPSRSSWSSALEITVAVKARLS